MEQPESPAVTQDPQQPITLHITPNPQTATQRTRNRIKEHGPHFTHTPNNNKPNHTLLTGLHKPHWTGWLPTNEIHITQPPKNQDKHHITKKDTPHHQNR